MDRNVIGEAYDGAALYGRFMALVSLVIGNIIAVVLIGVSIYLLVSKGKYTEVTTGTIQEATCNQTFVRNGVSTSCILKIQIEVNGKTYDVSHSTSGSKQYFKGNTIKVRYDPSNPQDSSIEPSRALVGWILLGVGAFIIIAVWIYWWIVSTFKFAAAAQGVSSAYNMTN
jgi:hypothetical protein